MEGKEKAKEQLVNELEKLHQQITELEKSEIKYQQIEESLTENEKKYRILVELAADGILIETVEGRILECNIAGAKMFGYTKEKIVGLTLADLVPEEFAKTLPRVITDKETTHGIFLPRISKKKDGTIFPTEIASKIINIAGKPRLIAYIRDITKRKEAEKKLRKARKMFASLFNSSPEAVLYHDKEGRIININSCFTELFGYTSEEMIGRKIDEGMIYPADKIEEGKILTQKAFNGISCSDYETIRKKKDGTLVPVIISTAPVIIDKKPQGTIALYRDITERKKMEKEVRENQQTLLTLMNNLPGMSYRCRNDRDWTMEFASEGCLDLTGYKPEEIINNKVISFGQLIHKDDQNYVWDEVEASLKEKKRYKLVYRIKTAEGKEKWVWEQAQGVFTADGKLLYIEGFITDITKRKLAEETLRESQQEFAGVFRNNPEASVYVDEKGAILNINPRFTELFGYTLAEIKGRNIDDGMIHPSDKIEEGEKLTKKSLKGYLNFETIRKKKDDTLFPVSLSISNIVIDGKLKGGIATYIDITTRKKMEEELVKLAHYDTLTGCCSRGHGLAHLEQQIRTANRKKTTVLLLYLDINDFKYINDTFGHKEGDKVLKEATKLFKSTLREVDIICRIGGDEFLLIFPENSLNDASLIRGRLNKNLKKLNQKLAKPYEIDFSIGLSVYDPSNPLSIEELIKIADENMYKEKKKKKEGK